MIHITAFCNEIASILGLEKKELLPHLETNLFGPPFFLSAEEMLYLYSVVSKKYIVNTNKLTLETTFFTSVKQMYVYIS